MIQIILILFTNNKNNMKKQTPILNQIVNGLNAIYEFAPTFWNWAIALSAIFILLHKTNQ